MTAEQRALFPSYTKGGSVLRENVQSTSKAWGRVNPKGLFPTMVVALSASDSRMGSTLHWDEERYLTTMEARRAQSFPDDEILLGTPNEGWKLMGNSVARSVALALGLSLRDAWLKNNPNDERPPVKTSSSLPVLNRRQDSRRPGVEIVIPRAVRRNKPEKELVGASPNQGRIAINTEMAPSSLVNSNRRLVAPNKARRSKFVPDSESSMSEDSVASVQLGSGPVSRIPRPRPGQEGARAPIPMSKPIRYPSKDHAVCCIHQKSWCAKGFSRSRGSPLPRHNPQVSLHIKISHRANR